MPENDTTENQELHPPPRALVMFIVASGMLSVVLFLLTLLCPLNVGIDEIECNAPKVRQVFFLTVVTMFAAGMAGGCLSNLRRIIQHSVPGPFDPIYCLSYYLRPLFGGLAGVVVFFLLLGGALTFGVGNAAALDNNAAVASARAWMTLGGRAPYIAFGLLAGYGSKEFSNKLADLADSLFALSKNKNSDS